MPPGHALAGWRAADAARPRFAVSRAFWHTTGMSQSGTRVPSTFEQMAESAEQAVPCADMPLEQRVEALLMVADRPISDVRIADLSTGTRRIVELAGLLALDARVLCLDEPTAGVAQRETEAFGPLILEIRRELDAAMLVIEHDMPLIMGISDRVYCLEAGKVIAGGAPDEVRNDPRVVASYLGTDERAIARSGEVPDNG